MLRKAWSIVRRMIEEECSILMRIDTRNSRKNFPGDEFLDNYLQFQKSTEQEFSDFVKNQPGGKART